MNKRKKSFSSLTTRLKKLVTALEQLSPSKKIALLLIFAILSLLMGISIGGAAVSIPDIFHVFAYHLFGRALPETMAPVTSGIIWNIRLPRVLLSFIVGASLAVSGSVMQSVLKNPLASSYTIGVSAGAGLGAVIVIVFGLSSAFLGMFLMPVMAISFGMATIFLAVWFASRVDSHLDNHSIVLIGMIMSVFMNAIMMTLASRNARHAQQISTWQLGSFSLKGWTVVGIVFVVALIIILILLRYVKEMDVLTFGDEQAGALGIEVQKTKWILIVLSAMLTGVSVAFVGIVGFVDLIAPHVIRRFFGSSHKYVIPLSAIFGGIFMLLADLIARTVIAPSEIPVGSVSALIGAPFFAYIFLKNTNRKRRGRL